jgi:glycosyltransferase involved in cell wall biosynthesis
MKVCWFGYLGRNHSWSIVAQNISRELIKLGHDVDLFSTNGIDYFPEDLKQNLKGFTNDTVQITQSNYKDLVKLNHSYDMQLSYTALKNFSNYFIRGNTNRFGIWNYETTVIPKSFIKHHKDVDLVLPSSSFSKKIFTDNGMPEDKQVVIPHGINLDKFKLQNKYPIKSKKRYKILANIAQPHLRKNIPGLLKAYAKAFTKEDDVCLVLKVAKKSPQQTNIVDISYNDLLNDLRKNYKHLGEIEVIDNFVIDIESLYNACDVVITMSHAECFWMPGLEGFAANKIVIAPRYGGQLEYMNDNNSLLIDGKEIRADNRMQYWEPSPYAKAFEPNIDHAASILKDLIKNYDDYYQKFIPNINNILPNYTWNNIAKRIVSLCR